MENQRIGILFVSVLITLLLILALIGREEAVTGTNGEQEEIFTSSIKIASKCKKGKKCQQQEGGRPSEYCYRDRSKGYEGNNSGVTSPWKLAHVVINIRHGDRTSINFLSNTSVTSKPDLSEDINKLQFIDNLNTISTYQLIVLESKRVRKIRQSGTSDQQTTPLTTLLTTPDRLLLPGELTSKGFSQLVDVGTFLRPSYLSLLRQISPSSKVFNSQLISIRSTNYNRTIQSVAGFLSTFFPGVPNIPITFYLNHKDEVMLGSLKHLVAHDIDEEPHSFWTSMISKTSRPGCPRAKSLLDQMQSSGYSEINQTTFHDLIEIFGDEYIQRYQTKEFITELADVLLPPYCHNQPLPCNSQGKCVTDELLQRIMKEADQSFCATYTSDSGGYQYTLLDIQPFIMELRGALVNAAESPDDSPLIHIFAGHDTVIAPVLSALGVYHSPKYCVWPHYASRLSLELWTNYKLNSKDPYYLRLVYNGEDVTSLIPSCSERIVKENLASFCPFDNFLEQLDQILSPFRNRKRACQGQVGKEREEES